MKGYYLLCKVRQTSPLIWPAAAGMDTAVPMYRALKRTKIKRKELEKEARMRDRLKERMIR
jgi:hypothetical protein